MKLKLTDLLLGTLLFGMASTSSAALQSGAAQHFTFTYDDNFWSSVVATGDTLTFNDLTPTDLQPLSVVVPAGNQNGYAVDTFSSNNGGNNPVISLTANNGFTLNTLNFGMTGHYALQGTAEFGTEIGMYEYNVNTPYYKADVQGAITSGNSSGTFQTSNTFNPLNGNLFTGTAWFWGTAKAKGIGSSSRVFLDTAFLSVNLAPVPEPETYTMMLAGLGLMGFVSRRRRFHQV